MDWHFKYLHRTTDSSRLAKCPEGAAVFVSTEIAKIVSFSDLVLLYQSPEFDNPAEIAALCVAMMCRIEIGATGYGLNGLPPETPFYVVRVIDEVTGEPDFACVVPEAPAIPYDDIQCRLSRLLVDFPVLMNSHILIGIRTGSGLPDYEYTNIPCAIAELSFGALPRESHGIPRAELLAFADNYHVIEGTSAPAQSTGAKFSKLHQRTPMQVAATSFMGPAVKGATRAPFVASFLELSRLAEIAGGKPLIDYRSKANDDNDGVLRAMKGIFADVATTGGKNSHLTPGQLATLFNLPAPFNLSLLFNRNQPDHPGAKHPWTVATFLSGLPSAAGPLDTSTSKLFTLLRDGLDDWLFLSDTPIGFEQNRPSPSYDDMVKRTNGSIALMCETGLAESPHQAAEMLSRAAVGETRSDSFSAGPHCSFDCALGFIDALHAHGVTVNFNNEAKILDAISKPGQSTSAHVTNPSLRLGAITTWKNAIHSHTTTKNMESVIAQHAAKVTAIPSRAPARRRLPL